MKNPDTVKVTWRIQDPKGGKPWEYSAEIVPDYSYHGPEYAMVFTFPTFEKSIKEELDNTAEGYVERLYKLMKQCFRGQALIKWNLVVEKVKPDARTEETFKEAQRDYLEAVAEYQYLGDFLILALRDRVRPSIMPFDRYIDRRDEWRSYLKADGLLRRTMQLPVAQEWAEQIFRQQPKPHRTENAVHHRRVETSVDALKQFFNGCHMRDVHDGTWNRIPQLL